MKHYGLNDFSELPGLFVWDPRRGPQITRNFKGPPGTLATVVSGAVTSRTRYQFQKTPTGAFDTVATYQGAEDTQPADQPLSDLWWLEGNDIEKSLWEHPKTIAIFNAFLDADGFPTSAYTSLRRDVMDVVSGTKLIDEISVWPGADANFKGFIHALLKGQDSYWMSSWVLRRQRVLALNTSIRPSNANVNCIYPNTDALVSSEGVPRAQLPFDLPDGIWLKKSPKFDPMGSSKWQLNQEYYWADDYSQYSYKTAT